MFADETNTDVITLTLRSEDHQSPEKRRKRIMQDGSEMKESRVKLLDDNEPRQPFSQDSVSSRNEKVLEDGEQEGEGDEKAGITFPERLMALLDQEVEKDALSWLDDGDGFYIRPKIFSERVLNKHFQGTKFESFTRKLNRW